MAHPRQGFISTSNRGPLILTPFCAGALSPAPTVTPSWPRSVRVPRAGTRLSRRAHAGPRAAGRIGILPPGLARHVRDCARRLGLRAARRLKRGPVQGAGGTAGPEVPPAGGLGRGREAEGRLAAPFRVLPPPAARWRRAAEAVADRHWRCRQRESTRRWMGRSCPWGREREEKSECGEGRIQFIREGETKE